MYDPVSSVGMLRFKPVSVWVAETSTPGKTAPLWSFTTPLICAVDCAHAAVQTRSRHTKPTSTSTLILFLKRYIGPPWFSVGPTVQFVSVHRASIEAARYRACAPPAASSLLAGSPTLYGS